MRKLFNDQRGSTIVLVAISFTVLMAIIALVIDVGRLYIEHNRLSRAVDAAALAGAQELPRNINNAETVVKEYIQLNGYQPNEFTVHVSGSEKSVAVEGRRNVLFTFAPIIGFHDKNVSARAKAKVGTIGSVVGAVPLAVEKQKFVYGEKYVLKEGAAANFDQDHDGIPDPNDPDDDNDGIADEYDIELNGARTGWFGALGLGGSGAKLYEENLKLGYNHVLKVGEVLYTETGNISGPTSDGVDYRLAECTHTPVCSITSYSPDCPTLLWVPVIVPISSGILVKQVQVVGFAAFLVESVSGSGINNYIEGYFVEEATSGELGNPDDFGLKAVKLIE